jgi:hypothetical protein
MFKLCRADNQKDRSQETAAATTDILQTIVATSIKYLSPGYRGRDGNYSYNNLCSVPQSDVFYSLLSEVLEYCYATGRSHLIS